MCIEVDWQVVDEDALLPDSLRAALDAHTGVARTQWRGRGLWFPIYRLGSPPKCNSLAWRPER